MNVNVCVPVLKRYDLLRELLVSLERSTVEPAVYVINNGLDVEQMALATNFSTFPIVVHTPSAPMGLAESWNWFITHTDEERVITNDDIEFAPESLAQLVAAPGDLVSHAGINMCSCFVLRDSCVQKVGLFDETISPGYAYFEDCDYAERMYQHFAVRTDVSCGIVHKGSQTFHAFTGEERSEHHRKFNIARSNFVKKWGFHPEHGLGEHRVGASR